MNELVLQVINMDNFEDYVKKLIMSEQKAGNTGADRRVEGIEIAKEKD